MTTRRDFVRGLTFAGTAGALGLVSRPAGAEPPPETTRLRLSQIPGICVAPQYVAEGLLRAEGFTDVEYMKFSDPVPYQAFASGASRRLSESGATSVPLFGFFFVLEDGGTTSTLAISFSPTLRCAWGRSLSSTRPTPWPRSSH